MWLEEFLSLFPEAANRRTGRDQDLASVEQEVKDQLVGQDVTLDVLQTIERSSSWSYEAWWNESSKSFRPVTLPQDCADFDQRRKVICSLLEELRHIEVVSIVLRFVDPDHFGIMSPPVTTLLNLPSADSHEDRYIKYLKLLDELRQYPDITSPTLLRIADVDMALWSAAFFLYTSDYQAIVDEMRDDARFQKLRLQNGLDGLHGTLGSSRQRIVFARLLLHHDHDCAAVIAARAFEGLLDQIADVYSLSVAVPKRQRNRELIKNIENKSTTLHALNLQDRELSDMWMNHRNAAVHPGEKPLSKKEAEELVAFVERLSDGVTRVG